MQGSDQFISFNSIQFNSNSSWIKHFWCNVASQGTNELKTGLNLWNYHREIDVMVNPSFAETPIDPVLGNTMEHVGMLA